MPTNNLSPKSKNKLGIASSIPPKMSERFGSAVLPYLQSVQSLFPPANPYGQATSNFLLGQAPQAAQRMAEGYPNVLFNTSNPLGGKRIVNPVALDMAVALPIGTALKGAGLAGGGVAATFAGIGAKTANREALLVAERMKAAGAPDEEIHKATGWFFGSADGKPRFEIPDDQTLFHKLGYKEPTPEQARQAILDDETLKEIAAIKQPLIDSGTYDIKKFYDSNPGLYEKFITARNRRQAYDNQINPAPITRATEQFVRHDKLFDAYPDTADIPLRYNINHSGGAYYDNRNSLLIGGGNERSTTLHELQHAIQQREGFARGGSPEGLPEALGNDAKALRTKANQLLAQGNRPEALALEKQARQLDSQIVWGSHAPQELYRRLAGESEARLTQSRMAMTGAERAASYPPNMYDVPVGDQIVRYGDGAALATTWHGSPHKFEPTELNDLGEFNAAKIGTGEGAQAYGHGHYTAENPSIAKSYQEELSRPQATLDFVDRQGNPANMEHFNDHPELASEIDNAMEAFDADGTVSPDFDEVLNNVRFNLNSEINNRFTDPDDLPALKNSLAKLDAVEGKYNFVRNENAGHFYKVDIPDEHIARMLDWDKPLSEQTKALDALNKNKDFAQYVERITERPLSELDGKTLQRMAIGYSADKGTGGASGAAELFKGAGIPGVRYLDAGSRGAEGGTSNFVVFPGNEHMMTILERNGQAMSPESQAIARYREIKGPKSVVRMEAALRTAGVPLPKNEPVAYIQGLVDRAHRRN